MSKENFTNTITKIIKESSYAVSHAQMREKMNDNCNRVTIYRILDKLVKNGTIHRVMDIDGIAKFAYCNSCKEEKHQHNHVHFSCSKCNKVTCLEGMDPKINLPKGYLVEQVSYTISGHCPECN